MLHVVCNTLFITHNVHKATTSVTVSRKEHCQITMHTSIKGYSTVVTIYILEGVKIVQELLDVINGHVV